ncbi:D-Ala-D-Ala carboxypeptidase family metallohydrolase, partial [Phenylobacterium sp.]|uniref:D-Ala-D-Ala carboxypeptidase family metallohydrolase n=1 Tax=Phenylobacterium sp. TaxID=1871053 RepID=UPI002731EB5C
LEKVRSLLGDRPITVTSAYRNPAVNAAVGGVKTSDHAQGHAADIVVGTLSPYETAKRIRDSGIKFDQLILETSRGVVHISFAPRMRRQVLTQAGKAGSEIQQGLWL